jgi:hypothetical protein
MLSKNEGFRRLSVLSAVISCAIWLWMGIDDYSKSRWPGYEYAIESIYYYLLFPVIAGAAYFAVQFLAWVYEGFVKKNPD